MYLFYAERSGWIPMGSSGEISVPKCAQSRRAIEKLAISFLGKRAGRVYLMNEWTQAMSELGPWAFSDYIAKHGKVVVSA